MYDKPVTFGLTGYASPDSGKGFASLIRNRLAAIVAFLGAFAMRSKRAGTKDRVLHRIVDLVLNRAVARPSTGHEPSFLPSNIGRRRLYFTGSGGGAT